MITVILVVHIMIAAALVAVVLLQRSEGGALGIGGGGGGLMTGRRRRQRFDQDNGRARRHVLCDQPRPQHHGRPPRRTELDLRARQRRGRRSPGPRSALGPAKGA